MKFKLPLKLILPIIILIIFLAIRPISAFYYYEVGKKYFNDKDYQKSSMNFKKAVEINPDNLGYRYYYAGSLAYLLKPEAAKEEFEKIIKMKPQSKVAQLALVELNKIKAYLEQKANDKAAMISKFARSQDNYIYSITNGGNIIHWNLNKMPLTVYIDPSLALQEHINITKNAFDTWTTSLKGLLAYKLVNNPDNANIVVSFTNTVNAYKNNKEGGTESSAGYTAHHMEGNLLRFATIKISIIDPNQKPLSSKKIYAIALHEIGHALGIGAHSYYKSDIMYPIVENKSIYEDVRLSYRDINTVKLLYKLDADISNFDPDEINKKQGLNSIILGNEKSRFENELKEAKNYINMSGNSPLSLTRLGSAYYNLKQYDNAVSCFKKALNISPQYLSARERLALAYVETNDTKNAIFEYNILISENPENIAYSGNLALLYIKTNNHSKAKEITNALVSVNPRAKDDETIKNIILALNDKNIKLNIY